MLDKDFFFIIWGQIKLSVSCVNSTSVKVWNTTLPFFHLHLPSLVPCLSICCTLSFCSVTVKNGVAVKLSSLQCIREGNGNSGWMIFFFSFISSFFLFFSSRFCFRLPLSFSPLHFLFCQLSSNSSNISFLYYSLPENWCQCWRGIWTCLVEGNSVNPSSEPLKPLSTSSNSLSAHACCILSEFLCTVW